MANELSGRCGGCVVAAARRGARGTSAVVLLAALAGCAGSSSASPQWQGAGGALGAPQNVASQAPASTTREVLGRAFPMASGGDEYGGGGGGGVPNVVTPGAGSAAAARTGSDPANPVARCGPQESYLYVSTEFRCADGSNPLGGNPLLGARARTGNVGANRLGHVIDRYVVPCPEGPTEVYVDMYNCPDGRMPGAPGSPGRPGSPGGIRRVAPPSSI